MKTIRNLIEEMQNEILNTDLLPERAAEILTRLSALLGNCNDEIRIRDIEYNKKLLECYQKEEKANRAKIIAEITSEYEAKRIARDTKELAVELMRSIKYFLKSKSEELHSV